MKRAWLVVCLGMFWGCSQSGAAVPDAADLTPTPGADLSAESADALPGPEAPPYRALTGWVDPFIGTRGAGNSIPGAQVPHGMVKVSPDTVREDGGLLEYEHSAGRIHGISHTHLQGPGGSGYGYNHLLLFPVVGRAGEVTGDLSSAFDHATEAAHPGYYAVTFSDWDVHAEVTATHRAALHRYTFPAAPDSELRLDLAHSGGKCIDSQVTFTPPATFSGHATYEIFPLYAFYGEQHWGPTGLRTLYFHGEVSRAPDTHGTWHDGLWSADSASAAGDSVGLSLGFVTAADEPIQLKLGLSFISKEQARANLDSEIPDWDFEAVAQRADEAWNEVLNRILVDGPDEDLTIFYSALYRTFVEPVDYTEGDRFWVGPGGEGQVLDADGRRFFADDWCLWDTFRTSHPLRTLVEPDVCSDVARSMLLIYQQGGWLPKCPWQATGYSRMMIANPAIPVLADYLQKGLDDFDHDLAWEAMVKSATQESIEKADWPGMCGYVNLGTPPEYVTKGYISQECDEHQAVSMTLEYAFDDWCLARAAQALGRGDEAAPFDSRAGNWANHWNPETGFLQPRRANGGWFEPFDPLGPDGFCEADAWKYLWFVPHDVDGLMDAMGGPAAFEERLDRFFEEGHFTPDNQPDFHVPWLYNFAGVPEKTQRRTVQIARAAFAAGPDGLPGNDDAGSTSAWYLFAAMGFYPVCPASNRYELTRPLFERVALRLDPRHHEGRAFVVDVVGDVSGDASIESATLNGKPLDRWWVSHDEIAAGGVLRLELSPE